MPRVADNDAFRSCDQHQRHCGVMVARPASGQAAAESGGLFVKPLCDGEQARASARWHYFSKAVKASVSCRWVG